MAEHAMPLDGDQLADDQLGQVVGGGGEIYWGQFWEHVHYQNWELHYQNKMSYEEYIADLEPSYRYARMYWDALGRPADKEIKYWKGTLSIQDCYR